MNNDPNRCVLEGVPRVHFYDGGERCPEDIILPSVMHAILEYLGESDYGCRHCLARNPDCTILCTYAYLVGVSGAAAFLSWKDGWHGDNVDLSYMAADVTAPERHILRAVGYEHVPVVKEEGRDNAAFFRERIVESIQSGMPVVGYGVIGPPEAAIIAGYDEGGDVLIGWSFFQDADTETEPSGYFRKRDWFDDTERLCIIGEKREKPSLEATCRAALQWMVQVARTPAVRPEPDAPEPYRNRRHGLAAYDAWAAHLLRDAEWPAGDEATLRAHHGIHDMAVGILAEARWYGAVFLAQVVEGFVAGPGLRGAQAEVLHAAACYAAEHDLMWDVWELAGGIGNPEGYLRMADPATRRAIADVIIRARGEDERAAAHMERALAPLERT